MQTFQKYHPKQEEVQEEVVSEEATAKA